MRRGVALLLGLIAIVGLAASVTASPNQASRPGPRPEAPASTGPNLLENASFEPPYAAYVPPSPIPDCPLGVCNTAQMADGWTPWWAKPRDSDVNPEYKPADPVYTNPKRVRSGAAAQQYFSFARTHRAGVYQRVGVQPGQPYCFRVWGHSWSANDDENAYSGPVYGDLLMKVGIDPKGGTQWDSSNVVWGFERLQYDYYGRFGVCATAQADHVTVFTYSSPNWPVKHNDVYWDDAELVLVTDVMSVEPDDGFVAMVDVDQPRTWQVTLNVQLPDQADMGWQAGILSGATLPLGLSAVNGDRGQPLVVTIDSTGLAVGDYAAYLVIISDPVIPGGPVTVPFRLHVVADLTNGWLPVMTGE